jgi:hypothetical protein
MSKTKTPITRREILIGGAAAGGSRGVARSGCCRSAQTCRRSCGAKTISRRDSHEQDHNEGWDFNFL